MAAAETQARGNSLQTLIVGAGPVGLTAAIKLARRGSLVEQGPDLTVALALAAGPAGDPHVVEIGERQL